MATVDELAAQAAAARQAVSEAEATLRAAQNAAAQADLLHGNAVNEAARQAEAQQLNVELAERNPRRRYEMLQSGVLNPGDLGG